MIKEVEHHQHMQQVYPPSIPSAPPTYDEAMYHQGAAHPQYAAPPPPGYNCSTTYDLYFTRHYIDIIFIFSFSIQ